MADAQNSTDTGIVSSNPDPNAHAKGFGSVQVNEGDWEPNTPGTYDPKTGFTTQAGTFDVYYYDEEGIFLRGPVNIPRSVGISAPGNATFLAPPKDVESGHIAVFNRDTNSWTVAQDYRGTIVYDKGVMGPSPFRWYSYHPYTDNYTTVAPSTPYDRWDNGSQKWVTDVAAQKAAVRQQALGLLRSDIMGTLTMYNMMGEAIGPNYKAYVKSVQDIAYGRNTNATSLPTPVEDPST